MPITLTLDDDLLPALRARSEREGRPVEVVVTDLVRRGLAAEPLTFDANVRDGIPLFPVVPGTPVVTHALVLRLMEDMEASE